MEFTLIILRLLWRYAPAAWLGAVVRYLLDWATAVLENEEHRFWLDDHPENAQWYGGWLAFTEARLNELIDMKAHRLLKRPWPGRDVPVHRPLRSVRSAADGYHRLLGIMERYLDIEHLACRRAEKLQRLLAQNSWEIADARPAEPAPVAATSGLVVAPFFLTAVFPAAVFAQRIRAPP